MSRTEMNEWVSLAVVVLVAVLVVLIVEWRDDMLKGKATLTFKFYEDSGKMQMYVMPPTEEPEIQEGEDIHEEDANQETLDLEKPETEEGVGEPVDPEEEVEKVETVEEVEEKAEKPVNTGDPLVLTPHPDGLSTGSRMTVSFECTIDQMRSFMDAEARGLTPFFSFEIK